eukprot:6620266-Lingulodinium_polyedra.AAC.2
MASSSADTPMLGRGGFRQQALLTSAVLANRRMKPSVLAERLLALVGWGLVSPNCAQWLAKGAVEDGNDLEEIKTLASVGAEGTIPANVRRDMLRAFAKDVSIPRPLMVEISVLNRLKVAHSHMQSMLNLPCLFNSLWAHHNAKFHQIFGANELQSFWSRVSPGDPKLAKLGQMTKRPAWQKCFIPYLLHGDGARFTNKNSESLYSVQVKPLLGHGFDFNIFPLFCITKSVKVATSNYNTMDDLWGHAVQQLNALFEGKDLEGNTVCGGYKFVCWGVCADLDFISNDLKMPHFNGLNPCWHCRANRVFGTAYPVTDVGLNPSWAHTIYSTAEGVATPCSQHPFTGIVGMTRFHVVGDLMHSGHLGHDQYLLGGVLHELVHQGPYEGTVTQRVQKVFERIVHWYRALGTTSRLSTLKDTMFTRQDAFACLSCKAAEANALVPVLYHVCQELDNGSPHHKHRLRALWYLGSMYKIIKDAGMFMGPELSGKAFTAYKKHCVHYHWLLQRSLGVGARNYYLSVKTHMVWHILDHSKWMNPRFLWCYEFEDFMGALTTSAKACVAGTGMQGVGSKVLENFTLILQLSLRM